MKHFFVTLVMVMVMFSASAQEHLSFKGIPIEGSLTSFCQKLKAKGFKQTYSGSNSIMFDGNFTGQQATVVAVASNNGQNVCAVGVFLPKSEEWKQLVSTYEHYKELYIKKYGNPSISKEENPAYSDSNTALMAEVHNGTAIYGSVWEVSGGTIELLIDKATDGFYEGQVRIAYRDAQGLEAKEQTDLDDI